MSCALADGSLWGATRLVIGRILAVPGIATVVSNGTHFDLTRGVHWSTREMCKRLSKRRPTSQSPTNFLASVSAQTSSHWWRPTRNVATSSAERADFERSGCTQGNGEKWRGAGRIYLAEPEISSFSHHGVSEERERKPVDGGAQCPKEARGQYFRRLRELA